MVSNIKIDHKNKTVYFRADVNGTVFCNKYKTIHIQNDLRKQE
jgi:hypothetical protein